MLQLSNEAFLGENMVDPYDTSTAGGGRWIWVIDYDYTPDTRTPSQNYVEKCVESHFRKPQTKIEISKAFWESLHKLLPKPIPKKIVDFRDYKPRFNESARTRQMLFSKAGKIPKRTRERKKCRSSR